MTTTPRPIDRVADLFVFAPIGAALSAIEEAPDLAVRLAERGRSEVARRQSEVSRHLTTLRSTGEVAVAFGLPELRRRAAAGFDELRHRATGASPPGSGGPEARAEPPAHAETPSTTPSTPSTPATRPRSTARPATRAGATEPASTTGPAPPRTRRVPAGRPEPATPNGNGAAPAAGTLPIPGYDALSASQVVDRLAGLSPDELDAVAAYEAATRSRRTVLGKIAQLRA